MSHESHSQLAIHPVETHDGELLRRRQVARRARIAAAVVLVALALGGARTVISRMQNGRTLQATSAESGQMYVRTVQVAAGGSGQTLSLPGTLQGFVQAPVAARAGGYLRRWTRDIGSRVRQGELLAEIETPELDQQLSQAIAARQQTAASLDLAKSSMLRWEALRKRDAVSQQELDERRSAYAQAQANLAAADANVERLRQLEGFKRVVAPFSGVITKRNVDIGDLIDTTGKPLFLLSQTDPLRVYVNVPQAYAQLVKRGQTATVTQTELHGRTFRGEVARTAGLIDAATRTMQVDLALPPSGTVMVPFNALLFRGEGVRVAAVDAKGTVHIRPVRLGRNFGDSVEILEGLSGGERLVVNPADSLAEGDQVQVVADAQPHAAAAKARE
jgi:RND family efflux transporter MFP subunit